MDLEGYRAVHAALEADNVEALVRPFPQADENVEFVTVTTDPELPPAVVLNALGKAGLTAKTTAQQAAYDERHPYRDASFHSVTGPKLEPILGQPGSVTFVDTNNGY